MGNEGTWVKTGEGFVNMARVSWVISNGDGTGYVMYIAGDPDGVELAAEEAAGVLTYIAAHTWTDKAE
jgi:hypothetical protein